MFSELRPEMRHRCGTTFHRQLSIHSDIKCVYNALMFDVALIFVIRSVHCNVRVSAASSIPTATDVAPSGSTASDVKKYLLSIGE